MKMFDYLLFNDRLGRLSSREAEYWQMMFKKILKVGEEFEVQVPQDRSLDRASRIFHDAFNPSHSIFNHGQYGVKEVMTDGSVPHGLEIVTVGKRFEWKNFQEMNSHIMQTFQDNDIYTSHHTGMHIHLLAGYTNHEVTELERNVPEIILANFYQLHRIFAPELYWIASGGSQDYAITRYVLFRRPPFDLSATNTPMRVIVDDMNEKYGKYQMVNMNHSRFTNREISRFHVEIRHPDTHLSPVISTALVALEVALLQKAIDLSQCGIISIKQDEYDFKKDIFDKFVNFGTGDRESDSTDLEQDDIENLQIRTSAMIRWLKSELYNINPIAYDILKKLSVTPSSLMRISGMSWSQIEEKIYTPRMIDRENFDKLLKVIILQQVTDCSNDEEWIAEVSERLSLPMSKTSQLMKDIGRERLVAFDEELGSYMFKQII